MCFFPRSVFVKQSKKKSGYMEVGCGHCPECLSKKSRYWSLRCSMQAQVQDGIMITLTYDNFERDENGKKTGRELPVNRDLKVNKADCQKFIKRLRQYTTYNVQREFNKKLTSFLKKYHYTERSNIRKKYAEEISIRRKEYVSQRVEKLSYLLTAEYGKTTHRAHYHALIFGLKLPDLVPYKRSKRNNQIYLSDTLSKLWNNGICTIDSVKVNGATARYCTKYCSKDSGDSGTFMLFSHGIGDSELIKQFNGKSYILDGFEYPIPKIIWDKKIEFAYRNCENFKNFASRKYRSLRWFLDNNEGEFLYLSKMPYVGYIPYVSNLYKKSCKEISQMWIDYKFLMPVRFSSLTFEVRQQLRNKENSKARMSLRNFINASAYTVYSEHMKKNATFRRFKRFYRPYQDYLKYWRNKADITIKQDIESRIKALPNEKYFSYKIKALKAFSMRKTREYYYLPRSSRVHRYYDNDDLRRLSCQLGANDIKNPYNIVTLTDFDSGDVVSMSYFKKYS